MLTGFTSCPATGEGVHFWLLSQANRCRMGGMTPEATAECLRMAVRDCGRLVPDREIGAAVRKAFASDWKPPLGRGRRRTTFRRMPVPDPDLIQATGASGLNLADLREASPLRFDNVRNHAEEIIDALFPGDPLLAVAKEKAANTRTMRRSDWQGHLEWCSLIVPSPMSFPTGINQDGRVSRRCLKNTGPRRFLVVEFDSGTLDSQAARMLHLARFAPLVVALHSGRRSLHGWFLVAGQSESAALKFFRYAVALGADRSTWTPCQLVRLPDGLHANGNRQTVFYFNPQLL